MGNGAGDVTIKAANGEVGDDTARIDVNAAGTVDVTSDGKIRVDSDEDLKIVVQTGDNSDVAVNGEKNVDITNNDQNANISELTAGGDLSANTPNGTLNIEDLTVGGKVSMDAKDDINVEKTNGEFKADTVKAGGDVNLKLDASLTDTHNDDIKALEDAKKAETEAKEKVEGIQSDINTDTTYKTNLDNTINKVNDIIAEIGQDPNKVSDQDIIAETNRVNAILTDPNSTEAEKRQAQAELDKLQKKMDDQIKKIVEDIEKNDYGRKIDGLENAKTLADIVTVLENEKAAADTRIQNNQTALTNAQNDLNAKTAARVALENAAKNESPAIQAGGNINVEFENNSNSQQINVGTDTDAVSMQNGAGGSISITAAEGQNINNVNLETTGDTNLEPLKADKVTINTNGNLNGTGSSEPTISAGSATVNATGNIGSTDKPFTTDVDQITASGKNVNISNDKDLEVVSVIGQKDPQDPDSGNVTINAKGDVTAGNNNGNANISGNNVTVVSTGSIGDQNNPIKVNSGDSLNANGKSIDLTSDKDIKVGKIDIAGDVNIDTKGSIESAGTGSHISGHDVNLNAGGNIGTNTDPLIVTATGDVKATSKVSAPNMRVRLIRPEDDDDDEWTEEDNYVYPQLAAKKVVLPNNKVPRRRIASKLIEEIIEEEDEPEEAEEVAKVDDDKPNVKPAGDGKKDEKQTPEEDGMDMMMIILIGSLLLLLIAGIIVAVILNKKADEDNEKAAE